jgi:hypothetical protein
VKVVCYFFRISGCVKAGCELMIGRTSIGDYGREREWEEAKGAKGRTDVGEFIQLNLLFIFFLSFSQKV